MNLPKLKRSVVDIWCLRLLIGSTLLIGTYQYFAHNNHEGFSISLIAFIVFLLLRVIYAFGFKRFVRIVLVGAITLLIIFLDNDPVSLKTTFSSPVYISPLAGMLFLGLPGLIVTAIVTYSGLAIRSGFAPVYADPQYIMVYFFVYVGLIWIIHWRSDSERHYAIETAIVAKNASREVERQNVALREQTQQILEEQSKLKASIETFPRGFILTDKLGNVLISNSFVQKIFDLEKRPENLRILQYHLGDTFDLLTLHTKATTEKQAFIFHELLLGNKFLKILINPIPMPNDPNEMIGSIILIEDITEEKVLQRSRDEFFSITSRELKAPLLSIAKKALNIKEQNEGVSSDVEEIIDLSNHLIEVVNDLIMTSRLEQSDIKFHLESVDIIKLVEEAAKELEPVILQKQISLIVHTPNDKLPNVLTDKSKIKEVLIHLLKNAEKFTKKGYITITLQQDAEFIKVSVEDTGIGIPRENQSLLFRKYQHAQNDKRELRDMKSTGVGLYISKLILENLGGSIYLERSERNKGSVFVFTVPVHS